jgi:hypothetical protein
MLADGTMTIGTLLGEIRSTYMATFERRVRELTAASSAQVIPEAALCRDSGDVVTDGTLDLPLRVDLCIFERGQAVDVVRIDAETMLSFDPVVFQWGEALEVELHPFTWDHCQLRFGEPDNGHVAALATWFRRWFDVVDERAPTNVFPGGVVHSLMGPTSGEGASWQVAVDLGSARLKAFEELLDVITAMGCTRVVVGG